MSFVEAVLWPLRSCMRFVRRTLKTKCRYTFHDRRKHSHTLVIILAGYKPFVWDNVFERIKLFAPSDADICIASSGLYSETLPQIAAKYGWSYLSTKRNCAPLILNMSILLHPEADFIYKIDEDIFVTKHLFNILMKTYQQVKADDFYEAGVIAPLIPINSYGYIRVLEKLGLIEEYEHRFGKLGLSPSTTFSLYNNLELSQFFWGEGGKVPHIDEMAERFYADKFDYRACPVRFSIGCIMFTREVWQDMGMFRVYMTGNGMGSDESQICSLAMTHYEAVIVSENAVVGHLSFSPQNETMKEYYLQHRDRFALR